jgi:hypothetical protein
MQGGAGGPLHRDSLLQRSKIRIFLLSKMNSSWVILSGGNGLDFFPADALTAQYLQPTSPTPGLPMGVSEVD